MVSYSNMTEQHTLFTDGGARGNPGPSATGAFLFDSEGRLVDFTGEYIGEATNNKAEYEALILGLELAIANKVKKLLCNLDSELVVMQVNGAYRVKSPDLKPLSEKVNALKAKFEEVTFAHVRREKNKHADRMVNTLLDAVK